MIDILNKQFFRIAIENNSEENMTLINIFTDPEQFDLPRVRKTPIASIVLHDTKITPSTNLSEIQARLRKTNVIVRSSFTDSEYDNLTAAFDEQIHFNELIFEETSEYTHHCIAICAMPCSGMIAPINKSPFYKLYAGSLVVLSSPFKYKEHWRNKLVYMTVDILSHLTFSEYVPTQSDWSINKNVQHMIGLKVVGPNENLGGTTSEDEHPTMRIDYSRTEFDLPCMECEERSRLLTVNDKVFYLSNMPTGIFYKDGKLCSRINT